MNWYVFGVRGDRGQYRIEIQGDEWIDIENRGMIQAKAINLGNIINGNKVVSIYQTDHPSWDRYHIVVEERNWYKMELIIVIVMIFVLMVISIWEKLR